MKSYWSHPLQRHLENNIPGEWPLGTEGWGGCGMESAQHMFLGQGERNHLEDSSWVFWDGMLSLLQYCGIISALMGLVDVALREPQSSIFSKQTHVNPWDSDLVVKPSLLSITEVWFSVILKLFAQGTWLVLPLYSGVRTGVCSPISDPFLGDQCLLESRWLFAPTLSVSAHCLEILAKGHEHSLSLIYPESNRTHWISFRLTNTTKK